MPNAVEQARKSWGRQPKVPRLRPETGLLAVAMSADLHVRHPAHVPSAPYPPSLEALEADGIVQRTGAYPAAWTLAGQAYRLAS